MRKLFGVFKILAKHYEFQFIEKLIYNNKFLNYKVDVFVLMEIRPFKIPKCGDAKKN